MEQPQGGGAVVSRAGSGELLELSVPLLATVVPKDAAAAGPVARLGMDESASGAADVPDPDAGPSKAVDGVGRRSRRRKGPEAFSSGKDKVKASGKGGVKGGFGPELAKERQQALAVRPAGGSEHFARVLLESGSTLAEETTPTAQVTDAGATLGGRLGEPRQGDDDEVVSGGSALPGQKTARSRSSPDGLGGLGRVGPADGRWDLDKEEVSGSKGMGLLPVTEPHGAGLVVGDPLRGKDGERTERTLPADLLARGRELDLGRGALGKTAAVLGMPSGDVSQLPVVPLSADPSGEAAERARP